MRRDAAEIGLVEPSGRASIASSGAASIRLHASCVELQGTGVVLLGASGSGKSDLALRLIDGGASLVADDRLTVERRGEFLFARPAPALAGLLEVRGFGIVKLPWHPESRLGLVVELQQPDAALARLPEPDPYELLGVALPHLRLDPRAPSAVAKIRLALTAERIHPSRRVSRR
jgi:HPr kinase/phosphorylase